MSLYRFRSVLLLMLLFWGICSGGVTCKSRCCLYVQNFSSRLKQLRTSFVQMREYYEDNDHIETALLDASVLTEIKSPFGCHAMSDILRFYLETVLPTAAQASGEFEAPIRSIGDIFYELKRELIYCRDYFSCRKPFELTSITDMYNKMEEKGLYKAMSELASIFNYMEEYMALKKHESSIDLQSKPSGASIPV